MDEKYHTWHKYFVYLPVYLTGGSSLGMSPNTLNKYLREHPNFPVREMAGVKRYNTRMVDEFIEIVHTMKK